MDLRYTCSWLVVVATLSVAPTARAADHADGPAATADPAADITDVFAWTSPDAARVHLVMDVFPNAGPGPTATTGPAAAKFSNVVQYVFHTASSAGFGQAAAASEDVVCTFDAGTPQRASCWAGDEYVTGDASSTSGVESASGKLRVFAGLRDDPFFFNLDGFKAVATAVHGAAATLTFDPAGCPALDVATSTALVTQLGHAPGGGPPQDHFARNNVLALVLSLDRSLVTKGGSVVSVWGSTNRP
jgi:Domain of unknown function (DUF4331)